MLDQLDPHQIDGAQFCASIPASACWDVPGLGKTPLAVRWLDLTGARSAYVLTTASHLYGFAAEIERWSPNRAGSVAVDDPSAPICVTTAGRVARADWPAWPTKDALVVDEAHHLKEPTTQRTVAVYGPDCARGQGLVGKITGNVLLLSGTPSPNYAHELWPHFHRLWPHLIRTRSGAGQPMTYLQFAQRFTAGRFDQGRWKPKHNRRTPELKALLARVSIRRTEADIGESRPPVRIVATPLARDLEDFLTRNAAAADELRREVTAVSRFILAARGAGKPPAAILADVLNNADLNTALLRRLMAEAKAERVAAYARDLLSGGTDKLLIFGVHTAALKRVHALLERPFGALILTGETPARERTFRANEFQTNPKARVFVGQTQAAGEAITLTAASRVLLLESTWTPKDDQQVIARVARRGQTRMVLAEYLTIPCAIEELVVGVNRRKASGNRALWG